MSEGELILAVVIAVPSIFLFGCWFWKSLVRTEVCENEERLQKKWLDE